MPHLALIIDSGELHPCTLRDTFGWSNAMTAAALEMAEQTLKSYEYNPNAKGRREPSIKTLSRTYDKCRVLLMSGHYPRRPELLPQELQALVSKIAIA